MFCPKCATQNVDGASFCRACGANISLLPQALTGRLPEAEKSGYPESRAARRRKRYRNDEVLSLERGIMNLFLGIGFLFASMAVIFRFPGGFTWGWCFLIPGFSCIGKGVAAIVASRRTQPGNSTLKVEGSTGFSGIAGTNYSPPLAEPVARTGELMPHVPSVTEGTTRHLGGEAPTQHFDSLDNQKPS
jgi:hypothetical protein